MPHEVDELVIHIQLPVEKEKETFLYIFWFIAGIIFCSVTLLLFFNGNLHSAVGEKWYSESDYDAMKLELIKTNTQELTDLQNSYKFINELTTMSYYMQGFADGNKGKGDAYFMSCVKKDSVLGKAIMNHGVKYLKAEILNGIANNLLPTQPPNPTDLK